jgi:hypothetical protein
MSSPAFTSWCSSGHLVENVPESCIPHNEIKECPYCRSTKFYTILSWHDREPETCLIPHIPIGFEWIRVWNDQIHGEIKVQRYDVSKVSRWIDRTPININSKSEIGE